MKPTLSPLDCLTYFVTDLSLKANPGYQPENEADLRWEDIDIDSEIHAPENDEHPWQVTVKVTQNLPANKNVPYNYAITVVGLFRLRVEVPEENRERMILVNGSSVLYSVAREVLRGAMAKGPFTPVMLPTVSFFRPENHVVVQASQKALDTQQSKPKTARKAKRGTTQKKPAEKKGVGERRPSKG